jgi:hypothetical protein
LNAADAQQGGGHTAQPIKPIYALFSLFSILSAVASQPRTYTVTPANPIPVVSSTPISANNLATGIDLTRSEVESYVRQEAALYGVNPTDALFIVAHESEDCYQEGFFDPALPGHEPNGSTSFGCWQFNLRANPELSYACVTNLQCSTELAMQWIVAGKINKWSTWSERCKLYQGAPDC